MKSLNTVELFLFVILPALNNVNSFDVIEIFDGIPQIRITEDGELEFFVEALDIAGIDKFSIEWNGINKTTSVYDCGKYKIKFDEIFDSKILEFKFSYLTIDGKWQHGENHFDLDHILLNKKSENEEICISLNLNHDSGKFKKQAFVSLNSFDLQKQQLERLNEAKNQIIGKKIDTEAKLENLRNEVNCRNYLFADFEEKSLKNMQEMNELYDSLSEDGNVETLNLIEIEKELSQMNEKALQIRYRIFNLIKSTEL